MRKRFNDLKLAMKMSIIPINFIIFILIIGIIGVASIWRVNTLLSKLNNERLIPIYELEEGQANVRDIRALMKAYVISTEEEGRKKLEVEIAKNEEDLAKHLDSYSKMNLSESDKIELQNLKKSFEEYHMIREGMIKKGNTRELQNLSKLMEGEGSDKFNKVLDSFDKLINIQKLEAEKLYSNSEKSFRRIIFVFSGLIFLAIFIGISVSIITFRAVVKPVREVTRKMEEISRNGGDLTQRINMDSKDEMGLLSNAFDAFMDKLQEMIGNIVTSSNTIAGCSEQLSLATGDTSRALEQISEAVQSVASGSSENAAVVEKVDTRLKSVREFSESTAIAASKTSKNSAEVEASAERGVIKVEEVSLYIDKIASSSREVAKVIRELDESSLKIGEIIKLITGIADQTNLLALNATIEAARAGEVGRGFTVVAEEIHKLSDETSSAAREITELIKDNRNKAENAVKSVKEVDLIVTIGVEKTADVKTNIESILRNIKAVVPEIENINKAVEEQAKNTSQISIAMNNIASTAGEMASGAEQMSASVEEQYSTMEEIEAMSSQLSNMAEELKKLTKGFNVI